MALREASVTVAVGRYIFFGLILEGGIIVVSPVSRDVYPTLRRQTHTRVRYGEKQGKVSKSRTSPHSVTVCTSHL